MNNELMMRENETTEEFGIRLYSNKAQYGLGNKQIYDIYVAETGDSRAESSIRGNYTNIIKGIEIGIEKASENSILDENREILKQIKIEKQKINVERQQVNKEFRDYSRVEMRFDQVCNAIEKLKPIAVPEIITEVEGEKELVLPIADLHYGRNCLIKGIKGEVIHEYNEDICVENLYTILYDTLKICRKEEISKINVLLLGDLIEGMLRQSSLMQLKNGMIDQTMQMCEILASWFTEMTKHLRVDVAMATGNHSETRCLNSKSGDFPEENMERIIYFYLKNRLKDNPNINFIENHTNLIYLNVLGTEILASHGTNDKNLEKSIREYNDIYGINANIFITGHLHHNTSTEVGIDVEIMRVRGLCGVDDYSMKLKKTSCAGTVALVIEEGKGKTITYDLKIK